MKRGSFLVLFAITASALAQSRLANNQLVLFAETTRLSRTPFDSNATLAYGFRFTHLLRNRWQWTTEIMAGPDWQTDESTTTFFGRELKLYGLTGSIGRTFQNDQILARLGLGLLRLEDRHQFTDFSMPEGPTIATVLQKQDRLVLSGQWSLRLNAKIRAYVQARQWLAQIDPGRFSSSDGYSPTMLSLGVSFSLFRP